MIAKHITQMQIFMALMCFSIIIFVIFSLPCQFADAVWASVLALDTVALQRGPEAVCHAVLPAAYGARLIELSLASVGTTHDLCHSLPFSISNGL
jgi:hypothetical protein